MILIIIDAHSKWVEAFPLAIATALTTVEQLQQVFAQFGLPLCRTMMVHNLQQKNFLNFVKEME